MSVDPGARECYCIIWADATYIGFDVLSEPMLGLDLAVCEEMEVRGKYAADLVHVSQMSGRVCALAPRVVYVTPGTWKGQVPKNIHHKTRILPHVTSEMLEHWTAAVGASKVHNLIDAYGIGLWARERYV